MASCVCCRPSIVARPIQNDGFRTSLEALNRVGVVVPYGTSTRSFGRVCGVRASAVDSYESSSNFANRMEKAWLISKVILFSGSMRCSDCKGTGFRAKWLGQPPISK
ncbi:hypothetical protein DVH24_012751 [Malus domestica]|uniref:Uncharacterized protein n=1 Tax=Malus domestica TaxID=3750 RepID=A0A498HU94_MALDO|nr:hypothetical protein DVH24_012751 [Malus domestica]